METAVQDTPLIVKTKELCETILTDPNHQGLRRRVDTFLRDENAKSAYQNLTEQGEHLHHKQHQGVTLTEAEIGEFEKLREKVMAIPAVVDFMEAQQQMHKIEETIHQYVLKTFELGRVPGEDDFEAGSCGQGCGCSH
ncbi:MAG: hypothetical protein JWN25_2328 [Verrucomicrobiales bacterium]|nr:hypothetical protein [Verrucomicrobiales bacterium]